MSETIEDRVCRLVVELRPELRKQMKNLKSDDYHFSLVAEVVARAITEEREACARVCVKAKGTAISGANDDFKDGYETGAEVCIINITARGQT